MLNLTSSLINQVFGEVEEDVADSVMNFGMFDAFKTMQAKNEIPSDRGILNGIRCGAHIVNWLFLM